MTRRRVAVVQSSYLPWKGYFDLIRSVDEFILLDEVQFTRRDWRSRNRIKTQHGLAWLSVPVAVKGRYHQRIDETVVADPSWGARHWRTIRASYARAPWFDEYAPRLEPLFVAPVSTSLSRINGSFLAAVCDLLGIGTPIRWSSEYVSRNERSQRLVDLCVQARATDYLSGPSARAYLDTSLFDDAGIAVRFADYAGYPEYPQLFPPFEHHVSIVDLLFCTGPHALEYMRLL